VTGLKIFDIVEESFYGSEILEKAVNRDSLALYIAVAAAGVNTGHVPSASAQFQACSDNSMTTSTLAIVAALNTDALCLVATGTSSS
jgi:hypothetical protein